MEKEKLVSFGLTAEQAEQVFTLLNEEVERLRGALKEQAVLLALAAAGAKNPKVVKAALDLERVELTADGELTGLNEQVEALKKSDGYLFETARSGKNAAENGMAVHFDSGFSHGRMGGTDLSGLSDAEYYAAVMKKR
ncbi:MAG: hypothetical protein HFF09_02500 [Oscillospiraceae bacterium]|nr:hypothetical protein [Oscillospiraceae bacterium]